MDTTSQANAEQIALWNDTAGRAWVEAQESLDRLFAAVRGKLLVEAVANEEARRVLDIGCGTGSTTLTIARQLGSRGKCVGVDISEPMIALANAARASSRARRPASFAPTRRRTRSSARAST